MNKISQVCGDALTGITAYTCAGVSSNRIVKLIVGKSNMSLTVSGDVPTVAELQTGLTATGDDKLIAIGHITNGLIDEVGSKELTELDTESGLPEKFDTLMGITGNIKSVTSSVLEQTMAYNIETTLRVWAVDNKGNLWGGETGYLTSSRGAFSPKKLDGTVIQVSFSLVYNSDGVKDDFAQDDSYLTLDNA